MSKPSTRAPTLTRRDVLAATAATVLWRPGLAAAASDAAADAVHALNRLGFGPAPGDIERVVRMGVDAWIDGQLQPETIPLPAALVQALDALEMPKLSQVELLKRYREALARPKAAATDGTPASAPDTGPWSPQARRRRELFLQADLDAARSRLLRALGSPRQLEEVMVDFWFNHFNVFEAKAFDNVLVENYERVAIRPHVFGRFRALLGATAAHPAMLIYLDNWLSVAPGFVPRKPGADGQRPPGGLNENYAREVMELHTLGVDGGYTQQDVTELARILTGWTVRGRKGRDDLFFFDPDRHDTGTKTWLGHVVAPGGQAEGEFALDVLARHPATARHIGTKLARHFVADDPPPALVDRLAGRFTETDGDLRAVMRALVDSAEFRDRGTTKFKMPYHYVCSAVRATGIAVTEVRPLQAAMHDLGQTLFGCVTPDGYTDLQANWLSPGTVTARVDFATTLASGRLPLAAVGIGLDGRLPVATAAATPGQAASAPVGEVRVGTTPPVDAFALLQTLGPILSAKTRAELDREPADLCAALALGSPDFMRR